MLTNNAVSFEQPGPDFSSFTTKFFYVMGKQLSGELSSMWPGLVFLTHFMPILFVA